MRLHQREAQGKQKRAACTDNVQESFMRCPLDERSGALVVKIGAEDWRVSG